MKFVGCSHGHGPYGGGSAGATWRVSFGILIPVVLYILYYRVYVMKELKVLSAVKKRDNVQGMTCSSLFRLASRNVPISVGSRV